MNPQALDVSQAKNLALGGIAAVVVVGLILGLVVSALIGRLIVLVVVVALAVVLWTQRSSVEDRVKHCNTNVSLLGLHVSLSPSDQQRCQSIVNR